MVYIYKLEIWSLRSLFSALWSLDFPNPLAVGLGASEPIRPISVEPPHISFEGGGVADDTQPHWLKALGSIQSLLRWLRPDGPKLFRIFPRHNLPVVPIEHLRIPVAQFMGCPIW